MVMSIGFGLSGGVLLRMQLLGHVESIFTAVAFVHPVTVVPVHIFDHILNVDRVDIVTFLCVLAQQTCLDGSLHVEDVGILR